MTGSSIQESTEDQIGPTPYTHVLTLAKQIATTIRVQSKNEDKMQEWKGNLQVQYNAMLIQLNKIRSDDVENYIKIMNGTGKHWFEIIQTKELDEYFKALDDDKYDVTCIQDVYVDDVKGSSVSDIDAELQDLDQISSTIIDDKFARKKAKKLIIVKDKRQQKHTRRKLKRESRNKFRNIFIPFCQLLVKLNEMHCSDVKKYLYQK